MAKKYEAIATVTVGSGGASTMSFTSIPSTYTDLVVYVSARGVRAQTQDGMNMKLNTLTTSFDGREFSGIGTSNYTGTLTRGVGSIPAANATGSVFSNTLIYISNYANSLYKRYMVDSVRENISTTVFALNMVSTIWANTAAITGISFDNDNAGFAEFSTATLYGIKNS